MAADDTTDTNEVSHAALATAVLEVDVGVWDGDQVITPRPGAEPQRMTSVSTRTLLADRWLIVDNVASSGYVGHGVYGWDASAQCYAGIWVDGMMGSIAHATGSYDLRTMTITYDVEVAHGGRTIKYREVLERPDDDTRRYTQYIPLPGGGEHPMIAITYRRRR
jgi:Protein of unknown function (DUF1579)